MAANVRPDINVTPLVDVVLVLLIIFMVVAPRLEQDVAVELPGIYNPDPEVKTADPLKVTVPEAGKFFVDNDEYDLERIIEYLSIEHSMDPFRRLVLRADARLTYADVREFLKRTEELGFPGTSLMVSERHHAHAVAPADADADPAAAAPAEG